MIGPNTEVCVRVYPTWRKKCYGQSYLNWPQHTKKCYCLGHSGHTSDTAAVQCIKVVTRHQLLLPLLMLLNTNNDGDADDDDDDDDDGYYLNHEIL